MRPRPSRRGTVLVLAIVLVVVVSLLLGVAGSRLFHSSRALRLRGAEETALFEARGGVRWGAERFRKDGELRPTVLADEVGELAVRIRDGRIEATYVLPVERGLTVVRRVSADFDLRHWREE